MKKFKIILYFFLIIFTFVFLSRINSKSAKAQGSLYCSPSSTENICKPDLLHNPNPDCESGYDPPCTDDSTCLQLCVAGGHYDAGGTLTGCDNVLCVSPTATPAPLCPDGWDCIITTEFLCRTVNMGDFRACTGEGGNQGNCCDPPPQQVNPCTNQQAYCRVPGEQTNPGYCEWDEVQLQESCTGYENGTLCCLPVAAATCGENPPDGRCLTADECSAINGTAASGVWDCAQNGEVCCLPSTLMCGEGTLQGGVCMAEADCGGTKETGTDCDLNGQICCVNTGIADQKLFCDASGNPTEDATSGRLYTAIGCIPFTNTTEFISFILKWALGLGAGIAFLLIVYAGFIIATSKGNPDKLKAGQELMTSAIMGLTLIIFSVFILRIIGIDILKIPGFSE